MTTFAGTWDVTLDTLIGKMEVSFVITNTDGVLAGQATSKDETIPFLNIKAEGNRLTWDQDVTTPMKLTLKFDVVVDSDVMTGTSKPGMFPASKVHGTRIAS